MTQRVPLLLTGDWSRAPEICATTPGGGVDARHLLVGVDSVRVAVLLACDDVADAAPATGAEQMASTHTASAARLGATFFSCRAMH